MKAAVTDLEKAESLKEKDDLIKSGLFIKLRNFLEDLGDEKSPTHKVINGLKYGVKTAQSIAGAYNEMAQ